MLYLTMGILHSERITVTTVLEIKFQRFSESSEGAVQMVCLNLERAVFGKRPRAIIYSALVQIQLITFVSVDVEIVGSREDGDE